MNKKFVKKLNLQKSTIANLNIMELGRIKGGTTIFVETCYCYTEHKSCSLGGNCCPPPEKKDNDTLYYC